MNFKNYIYIFVSTAFTALLNFLIQVYVARNSSAEMFGIFSIYITVILIAFNLFNLGLGHYFIKKYSQGKMGNKIDINSLLIFLSSSTIGVIILSIFFYYFFLDVDKLSCFLISLGVLGYSIHELIQSYYVGIQSKKEIFLWQPVLHLIRLLVLFFIFYLIGNLDFYNLGIFSLGYSFLIILLVFYKRKKLFDLELKDFCFKKIRYILKNSIWFAVIGFLYVLYSQFSIIYIGKKLSPEMSGYFNIGYTFLMLSLLVPNTFYYKILLPKMHMWVLNNKLKLKNTYYTGAIVSFSFGWMNFIILYFLGHWLIEILYGEKYLVALDYFNNIIFSIPFFYLSIHFGVYSYLGGVQKYKALILLLVTFFSLFINFILIRLYGILGATIGLVLVAIVMSILYHLANKFILFNKFFRDVK